MKKPHYRAYLAQILEDRCQRNPRYSLRSFARDLELSAPRLSGVLNGKFGLSAAAAEKIATRLSLGASEREWFRDSIESEHARSAQIRKNALARLEAARTRSGASFRNLANDQFRVLADWYHFALMELTETASYRTRDAAKMAKRLGITAHEASQALKRLLDFDLLVEKADGTLSLTGSFLANAEGTPSDAIRKHQVQLLKRAEAAVYDQTTEEREIRSLTVALNEAQVLELKALITKFQKKVQSRMEANSGPKMDVYAFTLQLFRLTEKSDP